MHRIMVVNSYTNVKIHSHKSVVQIMQVINDLSHASQFSNLAQKLRRLLSMTEDALLGDLLRELTFSPHQLLCAYLIIQVQMSIRKLCLNPRLSLKQFSVRTAHQLATVPQPKLFCLLEPLLQPQLQHKLEILLMQSIVRVWIRRGSLLISLIAPIQTAVDSTQLPPQAVYVVFTHNISLVRQLNLSHICWL